MRCFLLVSCLVVAGVAHAAPPIVAVMPFRDLSAGVERHPVGEAIRETVTADLKEISDLKVVERSAIDRVLSEQNLQANRSDLDAPTTVKIGKLLGASLIATGAYQKVGNAVRLTARFVKVETGEVVGSAKVDGPASDFLQLQDRVTGELLRSAGLGRHTERVVKRTRPKLKSLRAVELYGDAVTEPNEQKRLGLLKEAVSEEPTFEYASRDLDALEKRLRALEKAQKDALNKKLEVLRQQVAAATDPEAKKKLEGTLATELMMARRYFELRKLARGTQVGSEGAAYYLVVADQALHDWDALLRDGEQFMQKYPGSMYWTGAKTMVDMAIAKKKRIVEARAKIEPELLRVTGDQRWNLCQFGHVYLNHEMYEEARRFFRACLQVGTQAPKDILPRLVNADLELGDFAAARRDLAELEKFDWTTARSYESGLPTDG